MAGAVFQKMLQKIDHCCCRYLGLKAAAVKPAAVGLFNGEVYVANRECHKRTLYKNNLADFTMETMSQEDRQKLGQAVGKLLAKDVDVSFDKIKITRSN